MDIAPNSVYAKHWITKTSIFLEFKAKVKENVERCSIFKASEGVQDAVDVIAPVISHKIGEVKWAMDIFNDQQRENATNQLKAIESLSAQLPHIIANTTRDQVRDILQNESATQESRSKEVAEEDRRLKDKLIKEVKVLNEEMKELKHEIKEERLLKKLTLAVNEMTKAMKKMGLSPASSSHCTTETASSMLIDVASTSLIEAAKDLDLSVDEENQLRPKKKAKTAKKDAPCDEAAKYLDSSVDDESQLRPEGNAKVVNAQYCGPEFTLEDDSTVPNLLDEWFVSKDGKPSIVVREAEFTLKWRNFPPRLGRYKLKKAMVVSIMFLKHAMHLSNEEVGALLETYRVAKYWTMAKLATKLKDEAKLVQRDIERLWSEQRQGASEIQ